MLSDGGGSWADLGSDLLMAKRDVAQRGGRVEDLCHHVTETVSSWLVLDSGSQRSGRWEHVAMYPTETQRAPGCGPHLGTQRGSSKEVTPKQRETMVRERRLGRTGRQRSLPCSMLCKSSPGSPSTQRGVAMRGS